ncbi:hypothetical protein SAMN04487904_10567 [Actinopolyspora lacussalsi subsp. righensis]|uniref:Uncharacterized protein n=1 Tax=Actinopolyspora righensis TaxID=995060 RepID=A0A1I6ZQU6_9ACTN|nr:hypothetical protein SAMN04487904_10567 [Actinopolyspora righensis]
MLPLARGESSRVVPPVRKGVSAASKPVDEVPLVQQGVTELLADPSQRQVQAGVFERQQ